MFKKFYRQQSFSRKDAKTGNFFVFLALFATLREIFFIAVKV